MKHQGLRMNQCKYSAISRQLSAISYQLSAFSLWATRTLLEVLLNKISCSRSVAYGQRLTADG
ncbi:MAG: hypothetical protein F6K50_13110 [Moorea sp. SIO3I7]|uniref:hypothetical protein n=1 Tax=Moorena TaxID=1155738 RepID=UPI00117CEA2D|nr:MULTISPECIES: hypothetical protein [Moorena]NEN96438.1 hypothetical protein [Moorena sp. SIO3I7]NEO44442.1 hypothetical protein [Moorena sp. SIO4A3]NEO18290.1 hypothetical protein [Moorena sp. SIO4A5]NEP24260.1 hypothetical protein [Moorena sp. SIO3I6]NEQ57381.1 hypothetical protein [Moorena sp. SIO4A1]